jgi:hypothetical protein
MSRPLCIFRCGLTAVPFAPAYAKLPNPSADRGRHQGSSQSGLEVSSMWVRFFDRDIRGDANLAERFASW